MTIHAFDDWAAQHITKSAPLHYLHGALIGIDAQHYLETLRVESLLAVSGGTPLQLEATIIEAVSELRDAGLQLHFVFNGLRYALDDSSDPFAHATKLYKYNSKVFEIYEKSNGEGDLSEKFRGAGTPETAGLVEVFKKTLYKLNIDFSVAPYSSLAQLAYYEQHPKQYVDAVYGPSELLCFGVDKLITRLRSSSDSKTKNSNGSTSSRSPLEQRTFSWIDRRTCLEVLGGIPTSIFIDAMMISGSSLFLETFPRLRDPAAFKSYSIRDAVQLVNAAGGSVPRLCTRDLDGHGRAGYLDHYKRAITTVRHHVVITADGDVETLDKEQAPSDAHECIGLRLPEELYMYLSRGLIRPRVLNWLTSGTIYVTAPLAGAQSPAYRNLVVNQLDPLRRQALCLLTEPIHRYFHTKEITTKLWFDLSSDRRFTSKNVNPSPRETISTWNVAGSLIEEATTEDLQPGTLSFAVRSLSNVKFAKRTITPKQKVGYQPLKERNEVLANVVWRFLQLRGYVDEQHQLTAWGKVLEKTLVFAGPKKEFEEALFLAVELLRFDLLNPNTLFPDYAGTPQHGSELDRVNCMLVSRVACFGQIHHQQAGYSGPLSRHLLAYHCMISSVHACDRDLLEMTVTAMFLEGSVDRDRDDWTELGLSLPFYDEHSCALGLATMHYLDHLCEKGNPTSEETKRLTRTLGQSVWIQASDFNSSLDDAFHLWDSIYKGIKSGGKDIKDGETWDNVNDWLSARR